MTEYGNLEILGVGKQSGGRFNKVVIAGSGKITGSVECARFEMPGAGKIEEGGLTVHGPMEISGAGKVEGPVRADSLEVNGSLKTEGRCDVTGDAEINGSLKVEGPCVIGGSAEVSGSFKTAGGLSVGNLDVSGALSVEGRLQATDVDIDGVLKVTTEVQAEHFRAEGSVRIDGLLNAETVELLVSGEDLIESIGGGSVTVRQKKSAFSFFRQRPHLAAELIEADEIQLECTDARTVRGVNIHIGPECVVDRVEYSGKLTTDANASIGEKVRI